MNNIKVTICCKTYNHKKYIRQALDSFVNQKTNFDYEILVHDDASNDGTQDVLREYENRYPSLIRVIYQKNNQFSQGKCVSEFHYPQAKGKYIALCEGDDFWCDNNKLQKQFDALENNDNCSACVHVVSTCSENGEKREIIRPSSKYELNKDCIITKTKAANLFFVKASTKCPFQTSSYFFRKEVICDFISANWSTERRKTYDANMLKMFLYYGDIYFINEIMSTYRICSINSLTAMSIEKPEMISEEMFNLILEDVNFDKFTNYIYHKQIMTEIYEYILISNEKRMNADKNKEFWKNNNLNCISLIKYVGIKRILLHFFYKIKLSK